MRSRAPSPRKSPAHGILVNSMSPGWVQYRHGRRGCAALGRGGRRYRRVALRCCRRTVPRANSSGIASPFPGDEARVPSCPRDRRLPAGNRVQPREARLFEPDLRLQEGAARPRVDGGRLRGLSREARRTGCAIALTAAFAWHRTQELPQYARFCEKMLVQASDGISIDEAREANKELRGVLQPRRSTT